MAARSTTIRDVARRAGVSVGTASKAFHDKYAMAGDTRQRVLQAAAALHFTPNALIRSLQRGRTQTIGVLTWEVRDEQVHDITMQLFKGITEGIAAARYDTLLYSRFPERIGSRLPTTFLDGRIDGLVLATEDIGLDGLEVMAASGLPVVALYCREVPAALGYVDVDNVAGMAAATDYLLDLGHRRIAFYAPYYTYNFADRAEGYRQALRRRGIVVDPALDIQEQNKVFVDVAVACDRLLALPEPPTAMVAGDDALALLWIEGLRARGKRVPEDISVVGFDDAPGAFESPGLTTSRQPARLVGETGARFLAAMIEGAPIEECRAVLPVELIVRGTTAPPPPTSPRPVTRV